MIHSSYLKRLRLFFVFALLIACNLSAEDLFNPKALYLTWQKSPESTMTIRWITPKLDEQDLVEYHLEGETAWSQQTGTHAPTPSPHPFHIHSAELTRLKPGSSYQFRIGNKGVIFKFRTMPATLDAPVRFVEGGDVYHDNLYLLEKANRQAALTNPMFAVLGGDIAYSADSSDGLFPERIDRWFEFFAAWKETMVTPDGFLIPLIPAIGNHETTGGFGRSIRQAPFFYALFPMPGSQGYNVLDFGKYMSIVLLDSGHTNPVFGAQSQWLDDVLGERVDVPYKFAVYHVPAYPCYRKFSGEHSTVIRENWVPIFEKYGLNVAFEHHDHAYKRTHPLKKGLYHPEGVVYIGDGAWGVKTPRKPHSVKVCRYLAKSVSTNNFLVVTLDKNGCEYVALNRNGDVIDIYTQKK